jgi:predicted DNA-binding transcriptional regulator AlpA
MTAPTKGDEAIDTPPRLNRLIRETELPAYAGLRRTQIAELIKAGEFPAPIALSDAGRAKAWVESELVAWQLSRIAKRGGSSAP